MELKQLETFRMVATLGSFTQAAAALGYAQSSVTGQIQALEKEVGAALFDRMSRRTVLTHAGERLLGQAQQMLAIAAEATAGARGQAKEEALTGQVVVAVSDSLLTYRLCEVVSAFRKANPGVGLKIRSVPTTSQVRRMLVEGEIDVSLTYEETAREAMGFHVVDLGALPVAVVTSPEHRLAGKKGVKPADLAGETLLVTILGCTYRNVFERSLIRAAVPYEVHLELDTVEPIKRCAAGGMGIAAMPELVVQREMESGELTALDWAGPSLSVHGVMTWHKNRTASRALAAFTACVAAHCCGSGNVNKKEPHSGERSAAQKRTRAMRV